MSTDLGAAGRVARLVAIASAIGGCGPTLLPNQPADINPAVGRPDRPHPVTTGAQVIIGEMCPQGAGGRPAVAPVTMREVTWSDAPQDLANAVERGAVQRFAVFGTDGRPAGMFDSLGLAEIAPGVNVAAGTYVGGAPCSTGGAKGERVAVGACGPVATGCGLAVGLLGRPDDPPDTPQLTTGGACLENDQLAVDIDGDGAMELFPLAAMLDGTRGPAEEWSAAPVVGAQCTPAFTIFGATLQPDNIKVNVLGIVDVDGDGRMEVIVSLQFPTVRTIAVFTATSSPQRLELAGEGEAFPR